MATNQQMSLTVASRGGSSHLNKPARQLVPAFLQKLYEMVNDPADQDLIRWSDTGDSFFVLDQERFASEVLGRWFKHKNFSSFVRQLNMYGFHKIPHLQQGVLRSDSDTEFWHFEHPHFLRGQPDTLCLIQRKRQTATTTDDSHAAPAAHRDAAGNTAVGALSPNQILDINSIVNGIQAIKRHQLAISADLNELKSSNQHLWQEAMAARERHKKHQDTINRILKFLAGVFGHGDNQMRKDEDVHGTPHAVVPRKPQRLMISDGRSKDGVEEDGSRSSLDSTQSTNSTSLFGSLDTPQTSSETFGPSPRFASVEPSVSDAPTPAPLDTRPGQQDTRPPPVDSISLTTATSPPSQANNDSMVQTALTSVLNSPSQMQKLLAALASQPMPPEVFPQPTQNHQQQLIAPYDPSLYNNTNTSLEMRPDNVRVQTPYDFTTTANAPSPFSLALFGGQPDGDQFVPFEKHDEKLQKTYRSAAEITHDVDELQSSIQSLIQSLGIDPATLDTTPHAQQVDRVGGGTAMHGAAPPATAAGVNGVGGGGGDMDMFPNVGGQDFDFDSFLMDMPRTNEDEGDMDKLAETLDSTNVVSHETSSKLPNASSEQLHAFLDEVASQDGRESSASRQAPVTAQGGQMHGASSSSSTFNATANMNGGEPLTAGGRGRKRKSDVMTDGGIPHPIQQPTGTTIPSSTLSSSITGNKIKRKR
ncbi:hypothetical protein F5I97DRAFT_1934154 [Phlebopus sp. FC_14]|nr:hypothetical protein F5I97DRAFT_1934154 [Phlebopus sp. FC_14]